MGEIVVGVDGSAGAQRALAWAVDRAGRSGHSIRAVYAYPISRVAEGEVPPAAADLQRQAEELVARAVADADAGDPQVSVTTEALAVRHGSIAAALVAYSKPAELLVVGSRGLGGFTGLLMGSVSQQCAQHAACPVVAVPVPERARG